MSETPIFATKHSLERAWRDPTVDIFLHLSKLKHIYQLVGNYPKTPYLATMNSAQQLTTTHSRQWIIDNSALTIVKRLQKTLNMVDKKYWRVSLKQWKCAHIAQLVQTCIRHTCMHRLRGNKRKRFLLPANLLAILLVSHFSTRYGIPRSVFLRPSNKRFYMQNRLRYNW